MDGGVFFKAWARLGSVSVPGSKGTSTRVHKPVHASCLPNRFVSPWLPNPGDEVCEC